MKKVVYSLGMVFRSLLPFATPYVRAGYFWGGYSDLQVAPDAFQVRFHGNGRTHKSRSQDFALLRASEVCLENNFNYFIVADEASDVATYSHTTPSTTTVQSDGSVKVESGSQQFYRLPTSSMLVRCFQKKPTDIGDRIIFEADTTAQGIRGRYRIKRK